MLNQIQRLESIEDQPVILEQPAFWTRAFIWLIIGMTTTGLIWAAVAKIDLSVPAQGKLEPDGAMKDLRLPIGGVVKEIHVKGGQEVKAGDLLLTLDSKVSQADLTALRDARDQARSEAEAYKSEANGLAFGRSGDEFDRNQQRRVAARQQELVAQTQAAQGSVAQTQAQIAQTREQMSAIDAAIASAQERLSITRSTLTASQSQRDTANQRLAEAQVRYQQAVGLLEDDKAILRDLEPLLEEGGIARLQVTRQRQQVVSRERELSAAQDAILEQQAQVVQTETAMQQIMGEISGLEADLVARRSERERLNGEVDRLNAALDQAEAQKTAIRATADREAYQVIAENQKQDTQLSAQLARAEQQLDFSELRSPVDGIVFKVLPNTPGFVITNAAEPAVQIIPNTDLVAKVFVTNRDIGFIQEGMDVEVQVEAFPATEFGTITGKLTSISDDVLEPEESRPFYAFGVTIELDEQYFELKTGKKIKLHPGMAVSANIKLRERSVLSLFTDSFLGGTQNLENLR